MMENKNLTYKIRFWYGAEKEAEGAQVLFFEERFQNIGKETLFFSYYPSKPFVRRIEPVDLIRQEKPGRGQKAAHETLRCHPPQASRNFYAEKVALALCKASVLLQTSRRRISIGLRHKGRSDPSGSLY
jgi:hypothetical protein